MTSAFIRQKKRQENTFARNTDSELERFAQTGRAAAPV